MGVWHACQVWSSSSGESLSCRRAFEPCFPTRSVLTFQAEDSHAWGRTSTVQSDITHSAYGFQPHQNDCTTSETNRMGTTRHVPLTCRRIFELVWSASLRGAMSSILTIFFVKESFGICIYEDFRTTKDVLPTLLITSLQVALGKLALIHARPADGWTRPSFDILWLQHSMSTPACFQHSEVTRRFHMHIQEDSTRENIYNRPHGHLHVDDYKTDAIHYFNILPTSHAHHAVCWKQIKATFMMKRHAPINRPSRGILHQQHSLLSCTRYFEAKEHGVRLNELKRAVNQVSGGPLADFSSNFLMRITPWSIRVSNVLLVDNNGYQITSAQVNVSLSGKLIHLVRRSQQDVSSAGVGVIRSISTDPQVLYILAPRSIQFESVDLVMVTSVVAPFHLMCTTKLVYAHPFSCNNGLATTGTGAKVIGSRKNLLRGEKQVRSGKPW